MGAGLGDEKRKMKKIRETSQSQTRLKKNTGVREINTLVSKQTKNIGFTFLFLQFIGSPKIVINFLFVPLILIFCFKNIVGIFNL